ncbi:MAG TPA: type II secretion system minor pseudopilin GspI [Steroidobacteraceae bacterium]|nr:type II secretion system minor pseudopilin GspI [Steroidobacteraceae bacterium]
MRHRPHDDGFTLVEVLVALVVVAIGLMALMMTVSGTARTSGYLRDKTLAEWIALNRLAEVRLTVSKLATSTTSSSTLSSSGTTGTLPTSNSALSNSDTGEVQFAGRTWHYDTRYFNTTFQSTKRIVVRVWAGNAKTKGNPLAEVTGFYGAALSTAGNSNALDWTSGTTVSSAGCQPPGSPIVGGLNTSTNGTPNCNPTNTPGVNPGVAPGVNPNPATTVP